MSAEPEFCPFCAIVSGDIPARVIAESDSAIAFLDISPATKGHTVVVPKVHSKDVLEVTPESLAATAALAQQVAIKLKSELGADGINLLNNCGANAWQTVFHLHIHVIPRYEGDPLQLPWIPTPGDPSQLDALGELLGARQ